MIVRNDIYPENPCEKNIQVYGPIHGPVALAMHTLKLEATTYASTQYNGWDKVDREP
jgi:hypothetical protein